jgi:hypothetical protein
MEIKNIEPAAIADFEKQLQLENVKYLTLCTEEGIIAYLAGTDSALDNEIEVHYSFTEDFNQPVAKQMYASFMKQNISEDITFNPQSDAEEKFIESL